MAAVVLHRQLKDAGYPILHPVRGRLPAAAEGSVAFGCGIHRKFGDVHPGDGKVRLLLPQKLRQTVGVVTFAAACIQNLQRHVLFAMLQQLAVERVADGLVVPLLQKVSARLHHLAVVAWHLRAHLAGGQQVQIARSGQVEAVPAAAHKAFILSFQPCPTHRTGQNSHLTNPLSIGCSGMGRFKLCAPCPL